MRTRRNWKDLQRDGEERKERFRARETIIQRWGTEREMFPRHSGSTGPSDGDNGQEAGATLRSGTST